MPNRFYADMDKEDILVELYDAELEELASMYKMHEDRLPHLYSFLKNCIKSKQMGLSDFVTVMSPRNCWRKDGTFIASMPYHGHDVVMHSLDPSGKNLLDGLRSTKRFKFLQDSARSFTLFYAVHEEFSSKIAETLTNDLHQEVLFSEVTNLWCLDKKNSTQLNITLSSDVYVREINSTDITTINREWPNRYPDSEKRLSEWLTLNKGYGVCLKSNNQLVSWVMPSCLGQMAALQTLEQHKKRGFGSLAVANMSKYLGENCFHSCGTVHDGNTASELLMEKLGFKKMYKCVYIGVKNKN